jgi:hypothetical protein
MRKTSNDYRKELTQARTTLESVESHIKSRLMELTERFPEAIVEQRGEDKFKAKCVTKSWLENLPTDTMLNYISAIENHNASQEKVRQITIYESENLEIK